MNVGVSKMMEKFAGLSPFFAGALGSIFGALTDATGLATPSSTPLYVALCGLVGAAIATLPRYIAAKSHARLSQDEFIGKKTTDLIENLERRADQLDQILALNVSARHDVQGGYQAARYYIETLKEELRRHGVTQLPPYEPVNVREILAELDRKIAKIKGTTEL